MPNKRSGYPQDGTGNAAPDEVEYSPWLTGLSYQGHTVFYTTASVILEATLSGSEEGVAGASVRFYVDGALEGSALTSRAGVARLEIGIMPAGVYAVQAQAAGGLVAEALVAVCDPTAGCVTGAGWIESRSSAFPIDPTLAGKAAFGFTSRYEAKAEAPTGSTEFYLRPASLNFQSSDYEWLVVTGNDYARFKGSGKINGLQAPGKQDFKFMLWVGDGTGDGGADTFRIKIWWEDGRREHVIYDNGLDQAILSGKVVVQSKT
jgi:hypothetical protein